MRQLFLAAAGVALLGLGLAARDGQESAPAPRTTAPAQTQAPVSTPARASAPSRRATAPPAMVAAEQTRVVTTYCATCHSDRGKAGGLSLASFDAMKAHEQPEVIEKMIRKLRAGMMPPPGAKRPEAAEIDRLAAALESRMDEFAASNPNPGWRPFQRLTRAEYAHAVKDLLDLDVDVTPYLPADTRQPRLRQRRRRPELLARRSSTATCAPPSQVSRLAIGDKQASATSATYRVLQVESQMRYVEGTPFGSRGGIAVVHTFPADGDYMFTAML